MLGVMKVHVETFRGETSKKAYLNACKWLAQNVINKSEVGEYQFKISKTEANFPEFKVELFVEIDEEKERKDHCSRCVAYHYSVFHNQFYNCNKCNMKAHVENVEKKLKIKGDYRRKKLSHAVEKSE